MSAFKNGNTGKSLLVLVLTIMTLLLLYIAVPLRTQMKEVAGAVTRNREIARMELVIKTDNIKNDFNVLALKVNTNEQRWITIEKSIDELKQMIRDLK